MIGRRTLPSGALARVVSDEDGRVVWSGEEVLPSERTGPRLRVSGPVSYELSPLTAGHLLEAVAELVEHMLDLEMLRQHQRLRARPDPPPGGSN